MGNYRLFTVSRNSQHTSVSFNIETNVIPTNANVEILSGTNPTWVKGYNSAIYYVPGSAIGVFLILENSTHIDLYNRGIIQTSAYDNGNNYSGFTFETTLISSDIYEENFEYVPVFNNRQEWLTYIQTPTIVPITSNGGGATHIAKVTGQLKDLSSNLSDILMVSGGGGGGLLVGETEYTGKEAGGISGSGDNSADQSTGNAFGQGESGTNVSGGGSGLYGGYKGTSAKSGGAGSGYIGNSLLSNKKMVGYNVPTSSAEGTKTESVNDVSASAVSGKPKSGNGFARIKFLRNPFYELDEYLSQLDYNNYIYISGGQNKVTPFSGYEPNIRQYYGTDKILVVGKSENLRPVWDNENNCIKTNGTAGRYDYAFVAIPLPQRMYGVTKYTAIGKRENNGNTYGSIGVGCIVNDSMRQTKGGNSFETDWTTIELFGDSGSTYDSGYTYYHLEDMPYVDYLTFELSQGNLFWKNNILQLND